MGVEGTRFLEGHLVITPLGFVPIRLASSCAALFWFSPSSTVTVTRLLFSSQPLGSCFCRGSGHIFHTHLRSVRPPFLPPFFSHANSNFPLSFPIEPSPPASHPCAALDWYIQPAFLSSIPPVIPCFRALPPAPLRPPSVRTRRSSD